MPGAGSGNLVTVWSRRWESNCILNLQVLFLDGVATCLESNWSQNGVKFTVVVNFPPGLTPRLKGRCPRKKGASQPCKNGTSALEPSSLFLSKELFSGFPHPLHT